MGHLERLIRKLVPDFESFLHPSIYCIRNVLPVIIHVINNHNKGKSAGQIVATKIKVLLANEPGNAHETMEEFLQYQGDMELVGTILDPIELLLAIEETQAEVVVLTLPESGEIPGICTHLLTEYPHLLVLALSADLESACLYRRGIIAEPLSKISEEGVLGAIRRVRTD